jgi:hypothetical protein
MATNVLRSQLTLLELAKRTLDGQHLAVAEVLAETNEVLTDAVWVESNQPTSHITTKRISLPAGTWRKVNAGVYREASATQQIVETIGLCESYSVVDKFLVDIAANPREFRSSEDLAFVEGLSQTLADALFRDNANTIPGNMAANPERFNGFVIRYNSVNATGNVITEGGTATAGDTTSVWVVQWGPSMVHMIYPKGSKMGIEVRDLGEQTVQAGLMTTGTDISAVNSGGSITEYQAYRTHFKLAAGLVVRDDRCVQRLCNIDDLGDTAPLDEDNIIVMLNKLPYQGKGAVIYCNNDTKTQLDILAKDSGNLAVASVEDAFGRPVTVFRGVPVRRVDAITNTEYGIA